jgi:hypothetical protein
MQSLTSIANTHPDLRETAIRSMCQALLCADHLAASILNQGVAALALRPDIVAELCIPPARDGNTMAALALVLVETDIAEAAMAAERQLPLSPPANGSEVQPPRDHSTLALLAAAVGPSERETLSDSLIAHALNHEDAAFERRDALHALATLAPHLDHDTRARHFTTAMEFAHGRHDGSADDDLPNAPFDRFRFNFGPTTLRPDGLLTAACLACPGQQTADVLACALEILQNHDGGRSTVVRALFQLPLQEVHLEPALLASHSDHLIRLLAAGLWCEAENADPLTGAVLARDRNALVRQYMAMHADKAHLQELLREDPRRSVRSRVPRHES